MAMDIAERVFGDMSEEFEFDEASLDYGDAPLFGWIRRKGDGQWFAFDCQPVVHQLAWHWTLVRLAGSSFRDLAVHGNESRPSCIEGTCLVRDLDECVSRDSSGLAFRRSRGGGTLSTTSWSERGSSCGFPTGMVQRGSPCSSRTASAPCASGGPPRGAAPRSRPPLAPPGGGRPPPSCPPPR